MWVRDHLLGTCRRQVCENASDILLSVTRGQCRAARALLEWSLDEVAQRAGVGRNTVHRFESGEVKPRAATLTVLRLAFEKAGIEFIENGRGPGVRLVTEQEPEP